MGQALSRLVKGQVQKTSYFNAEFIFFKWNFRNPKYGDRPSFSELFEILNGCDDELLNWSEEDKARIIDSPNAMVIGSTLEEGKCLFKDLQHRYHGVTPDDVA